MQITDIQHLFSTVDLFNGKYCFFMPGTRLDLVQFFLGNFHASPPPPPLFLIHKLELTANLTFSSSEQVFIQAKDRYISNELPASATLVFSICRSKDRKTKEILTFHFPQIFHIEFVRFVIIPAVFSLLLN